MKVGKLGFNFLHSASVNECLYCNFIINLCAYFSFWINYLICNMSENTKQKRL